MDIKLNQKQQNELNLFLDNKNEKLQKLLSISSISSFSFSKEEIDRIEKAFIQNRDIRECIYIYIGEAVIKNLGGFWSIGKFKKDEAYNLPIILGWGENDYSPRICPDVWLKRIERNGLGKTLGDLIFSLKECS